MLLIIVITIIASLNDVFCAFRYGSIWKGCLTLYSGKGGDVHKIGEYVCAVQLICDVLIAEFFTN